MITRKQRSLIELNVMLLIIKCRIYRRPLVTVARFYEFTGRLSGLRAGYAFLITPRSSKGYNFSYCHGEHYASFTCNIQVQLVRQ